MLMATPVMSNAMHIMEGFLPVNWAIIWWVIFIPFFVIGLKNITKIVKEQPKKKLLLALCGAFVFVLSALKNSFCNRKLFTSNRSRTFSNIIWA